MRLFTLSLAAVLAAPSLCLAAGQDDASVSEVVVEAARVPSMLVDEPDIQVIDRAEIDARQATFAAQILDTVPGVAVTDDGAFGGVTSVRMRGASSDKTLVLIDGVPQNDPSDPNGAFDFANLDLSDIQKVEILQGPQGALWGSSAIGGVISFTTRELDGWRAAGEGGSLDTFDGSAGIGRRTDDWALGASISGDRTSGVAKADGIGPRNPYWSWTAGANGRWDPAATLTLDAHVRFDQSYAGVDGYDATTFAFGYTPQYAATRGWTGAAQAIAEAPWGFIDTLSLGVYSLDRSDIYIGHPEDSSSYWALTQDYRFTAERGAAGDPFGIIVGAERQNTRADLSTGAALGLGTTSGFAVARARLWTPFTLTGAIRYDAPDAYPGQATGRIAAVLKLGVGFSVEGSWGQGFKVPTISEIACDFCFPAGPSVGLKPEHAEGWDAALAWASDDRRFTTKATVYQLAVRDQIEFSPSFPFVYVNIERTQTTGVEVETTVRLMAHLTLQATYAYTDAIDVDAGTRMLRVPRDAGSVSLLWNDGRWGADLTVRAEGPDADIDPSTFAPATRPGFLVASLAGSYAVRSNVDLTARIEDIANTRYEEALGYGEPRQMLFVGVRLKN